jgi:phosphoribosylanthranilate isomerase
MNQGTVKICGLRAPEHAVVAAEAGADLLGFVFAEARRKVTPEVAAECVRAAKAANPRVRTVGLFVDAPAATVAAVRAAAGLDLVQLHGAVDAALLDCVGGPALVVFRAEPGATAADLLARIDAIAGHPAFAGALIDAWHPTAAGGTGHVGDWALAAEVAAQRPLILAGGLGPDNVAAAIAAVRPAGVDVSSGIERDGVKAQDLIRAFVANARAAFAAG